MSLLTIVAVLQAALSLLSSIQINPNLPIEVKLQAADLAGQAVEIAIGGIAELSYPGQESGSDQEMSAPYIVPAQPINGNN